MKTINIKRIVVECGKDKNRCVKEFNVDSEIFNDVLLEGATRFVERYIKDGETSLPAVLITYEKQNVDVPEKHACYNSYYVTINAGFHKKAEMLRKNFLKIYKIDLSKEKLGGLNGN